MERRCVDLLSGAQPSHNLLKLLLIVHDAREEGGKRARVSVAAFAVARPKQEIFARPRVVDLCEVLDGRLSRGPCSF